MFKNIATARSECTVQYENLASYNTDSIVTDVIDFFGDDWKAIRKLIEKINFYIYENHNTD